MKRPILVALIFSVLMTASAVARADVETWFWVENRIPLIPSDKPTFPRLDLRVVADFRLNVRSHGLDLAFLRAGPLLYVTKFLFIAVHATILADRVVDDGYEMETRVEVEPNFFGRIGSFTFNDRNRFEYRYREIEQRYRYRNQLRVNYAPIGAKWIPFLWDEVLADLSGLGVNQNRLSFGIGRMISKETRLDVGYILRSREEKGIWTHDSILNLYLFIDAPTQPR